VTIFREVKYKGWIHYRIQNKVKEVSVRTQIEIGIFESQQYSVAFRKILYKIITVFLRFAHNTQKHCMDKGRIETNRWFELFLIKKERKFFPTHDTKAQREKTPGTHQIGDQVSPSTGLDVAGEEKNLSPLPGLELRTVQLVAW
jgi:hypothetical protein